MQNYLRKTTNILRKEYAGKKHNDALGLPDAVLVNKDVQPLTEAAIHETSEGIFVQKVLIFLR